MSARWESEELLLQPIAADQPCGENLEDTALLASFDTFRLFGQAQAARRAGRRRMRSGYRSRRNRPNGRRFATRRSGALQKSKDLRLLAHLGTALLRTDGLPAFAETLNVASQWLETHWSQIYPLVDEDAILRRNALNCFADPMAVVDGLRRCRWSAAGSTAPSACATSTSRRGQPAPATATDKRTRPGQRRRLPSMPLDELTQLHDERDQRRGLAAEDRRDDARGRGGLGGDAELRPADGAARQNEPGAAGAARVASGSASRWRRCRRRSRRGDAGARALHVGGAIKSRQDAIRALDAVADFFRQTEPSSPIPLFLERAKRLVSKDFLEVLADIAPDAVAQARAAGGLKQGE